MTKYLEHFGLNKPPFAAHAAGTDVFVAPQVATAIAGLQKALATEDAIVCVSGPVGSGKTTIAKRALDSIGEKRGIVTIGRMQLGHDEVLELLLAGLGARQLPKSTVHRFAAFRRLLQQYAEQNARVFILVEDAPRVGLEALSELEALTAADAGVSNGANLVLLGDDSLSELLRDPKMARIKQRVRSRQVIAAQGSNELGGYLKHNFRLAGAEFDEVFENGSVDALHRLSDGLPRVVNNLVECVLAVAAEKGQASISPQMIQQIAAEEFGLTVEHNIGDIEAAIEQAESLESAAETPAEPEPVVVDIAPPEPAPEPAPAPEAEPDLEPEAEPDPAPEAEPVLDCEPELVAEPASRADIAPAEDDDDDIPELIQDTLPDLEILAPELAGVPASAVSPETEPVLVAEPEAEPEAVADPTESELPMLSNSMRLDAPPVAAKPSELAAEDVPAEARDENGEVPGDIPDWERDPTLAQLRPDLDALERAMAVAQGTDSDNSVEAEALRQIEEDLPKLQPEPVEEVAEVVPEITLDKQIQAKIEEATEALKQTQIDATAELRADTDASNDDNGGDDATADRQAAPEPQTDPEPAATAANVDTKPQSVPPPRPISDIDIPAQPAKDADKADRELEKIATELAKAKTIEDVDDHLAETLFGEEFSMMAAQVAANAAMQPEVEVASGTPAGETIGAVALSLETEDEDVTQAAPEAEPEPEPEPLDTSASQRLQVLRDLNAAAPPPGAPPTPDATESIVMSAGGHDDPAAADASVDSIEDQISTSMTQTLEALSINSMPKSDRFDDDDDDDDDEETKKGFFSRFRKK